MASKLAILGGKPIRENPFKSNVVVGAREKKIINQVLDNEEFSRFMGAPTNDIKDLLLMTSEKAENNDDRYFSFLGGNMVRRFEADFARKFNVPFAMSVNSATSGLSTALGATGIEPESEVITTSMSFSATATSILLFNAIPVFVDVSLQSFCLDPKKIESAITEKTRAILVVHLLGFSADMDPIMKIAEKYNLMVIEDACQAPGTKYKEKLVGTIGHLGVFSFNEPKNIQTGEGGMVITRDPELAKKIRLIRNHGEAVPDETWNNDSLANIVGMNFRMTELTAALGIAQLTRLDQLNKAREENAAFLTENLKEILDLTVPNFPESAIPHVYPLIYDNKITGVPREKILTALRAEGIPVGSGYLRLMYENQMFLKRIAYGGNHYPWINSNRKYAVGDCPIAENLINNSFIWFYHIHFPNSVDDMEDVVKAFKKVFENMDKLRNTDFEIKKMYKW